MQAIVIIFWLAPRLIGLALTHVVLKALPKGCRVTVDSANFVRASNVSVTLPPSDNTLRCAFLRFPAPSTHCPALTSRVPLPASRRWRSRHAFSACAARDALAMRGADARCSGWQPTFRVATQAMSHKWFALVIRGTLARVRPAYLPTRPLPALRY